MAETNALLFCTLCIILQLVLSGASTPAPCPNVVDHKYFNCSHHALEDVPKGLPSTLEVIILSHNRIKKLNQESFQGLPNLVKVDVSYNSISRISSATFSLLTKLETLILRKNQLYKPESGLFQGLKKLTVLDISYMNQGIHFPNNFFSDLVNLQVLMLDGNKFSSLDLGDNCNLPTVKVLSLANNTFSTIANTDFLCFKKCNLSELLLSGNKITHVESRAFSYFDTIKFLDVSRGIIPGSLQELNLALQSVSLESLKLEHLNLVSLTRGMFFGLQNLTTLDLSYNWIKNIETGSFSSLVSLKKLDLYHNNISTTNNKTFSDLPSLTHLDLGRNNLTVICNGFFISLSNSSITYLNLKMNDIKNISNGAFEGLKDLEDLELAENSINQVLNGGEFNGLDRLQILNLGINEKIGLETSSFSRIPGLKTLIMDKVQLKSIKINPSPFRILKQLEVLDLSNNNMNDVYQNTFSGMKTLKKLYLNHNNLYLMLRINSPVLFLNGLSELRLLDLSSNGFSNIHVDSFADLRSLNNLYINHNKLTTLSSNLFKPVVRLQYLDLSNNKFNLFNQSMFQNNMPHLEKMAAGGSNPFACTCDLEWFRNWIDSSEVSIVDINECICDSPPAYRNKPILSFHPQDLNCDHVIPLYIWIVSGSVLILIIVMIIVIVRRRYYIKYLYYVVRVHTKGYQPLNNEDNVYKYDAFVSHSSEDEKWVKDMRDKLENENGFKLCFHKRDFDIGKPIATNIIESMDSSRYTICVITEAFLDSGWCKYELQFALSRLFKERKEVIILIFLQKIPDQLLTDQLKVHRLIRRFVKDNTYIEWPHNADEELAFWEKLKDSLR